MADSIIGIGLRGMQEAMARAAADAERVSNPKGDEDMVEGMLGLKQDLRDVKANAKVIKVGEELQDEILDILA